MSEREDDSMQVAWQAYRLARPGFHLAYYVAGKGPTILFLSGGPGDDHRYLRPVANPLTRSFHCVLFDQRGTGRSCLPEHNEIMLAISTFFEDIEALRAHLHLERLNLVGHSWGATLALLYCALHPEQVASIALIGLGPLSDEFAAVAAVNKIKPLTAREREELATLSALRRRSIEEGHLEVIERFQAFFPAHYNYDPHTATYINQQILPAITRLRLWEQLQGLKAAMLILYGYQDFEPITQAYLIKERIPHAQLCFLNECGHVPWLEQPEKFYEVVEHFLHTYAA